MLSATDSAKSVTEREFFDIDYTFFLNIGFVLISVIPVVWHFKLQKQEQREKGRWRPPLSEKILLALALGALGWIVGGFLFGGA
jgi:hypothetical protein